MIDHNHLCTFSAFPHPANIAVAEITTFAPGAFITISGNLTANIGRELEAECFKIPIKARGGIVESIKQAHKFTVFNIELQACAFPLDALKTDIVVDTLDQCCIKGFDMFLDK